MPVPRLTITRVAAGCFMAAVLLMIVGCCDGDGGNCETFRVGLMLTLTAAVALLYLRGRASDSVVERVRQDAYDDGYQDGCDASRPARVVGLEDAVRRSSRRRLTLDRPAHQLSQQSHVGS